MFNIKETADNVKATAKTINKDFLKVSNEIVDETLAAGQQWQVVLEKALKTGTSFMDQQQDLALTALEGAREQYAQGNKRLRKLLGFKTPAAAKKAVKSASATAKKATEKVSTTAKKTTTSVKATVKKATAKASTTVTATAKKATAKVTAPKASAAKKDDLKTINGIGPKVQTVLNEAGIFTYAQLAKIDVKKLESILLAASPRYAMFDVKEWIKAAQQIAK